MTPELWSDLLAALERPHRMGTIGGDLEEQLAHCASFSSVLRQVVGSSVPERGIDLGTGGGLPGVALAGMWPTMQWTLVDVRAARIAEVERTVLRLGYDDRVTTVAAEAQQLGHDPAYREQFGCAVARAFGPSSTTAECAAGMVAVGGVFVVSEPPEDSPDRWNEQSLRAMGFAPPEMVAERSSAAPQSSMFAVFEKISPTPERIPRLPARSNRGWYLPKD